MALITERQGRHFIDEIGRIFWINGPENFCYLSEQRQWREGLSLEEVLEWKQCAPTGLVSQRFGSLVEACEAFENNRVSWAEDLYLQRMGDEMALHRSIDDYRPTVMKLAEERGNPVCVAPWLKTQNKSLEACLGEVIFNKARREVEKCFFSKPNGAELSHPFRRRRISVVTR